MDSILSTQLRSSFFFSSSILLLGKHALCTLVLIHAYCVRHPIIEKILQRYWQVGENLFCFYSLPTYHYRYVRNMVLIVRMHYFIVCQYQFVKQTTCRYYDHLFIFKDKDNKVMECRVQRLQGSPQDFD